MMRESRKTRSSPERRSIARRICFLLGLAPSFTRFLVALSLANSAQTSRNFPFSHRAQRHLCTDKSRVKTSLPSFPDLFGSHTVSSALRNLKLACSEASQESALYFACRSHFTFEIVSNAVFLSPVKLY